MIRRLVIPHLSWVMVIGVAAFAAIAGFQLGGGTVPIVPKLADDMLYVGAAGLFGLGVFGTLLKRPDVIGRIAPTVYVLVALLPLLRFPVPGIAIIRFLPLALMAPVVYSLYRDAEPVASHTRIARLAVFSALAIGISSIISNQEQTDLMRLLLMIGGIVLLVGAAPRAWSVSWVSSVEKALWVAFWAIALSSIMMFPFGDSFIDDRLRGAFSSANALGALLALTTPIAASRSRAPLAYWSVGFALMILSGTRGGLLALSIAAAMMLIRRRKPFQLAGLVVIGLLVLSSGVVRTRATQEQVSGINTRQLIWEEVYEASLGSPLVGHGFGSLAEFEYSAETQRWAGIHPQTHSSWLDAVYEQGFLGLILWSATLLLGSVAALRAGPIWASTILAGLVSATFESWMFAIGGGIGSVFWLIFGAAAILGSKRGDGEVAAVDDRDKDRVEGSADVDYRRPIFQLEIGETP